MNHPGTTLYVPLGPDLEIKVTLQARQFNGIASDPKTIVRDCSIVEFLNLAKQLHGLHYQPAPTIDYPVQRIGPDLAEIIATDILTPLGEPECQRVQLMLRQPDNSERDMGGNNKASLISIIRRHLP